MCGRYSMFSSIDVVQDRFNAEALEKWPPHYNAAPSQRLPVILNDNPTAIQLAEWGFRPKWLEGRAGPINARGETIHEKPMFRSAVRRHRCLILADSFFEWDRRTKPRTPWRILLKSEKPFAFAGIWEPPVSAAAHPSFAIITTRPNGKVALIHDRMPVILDRSVEKEWLKPSSSVDFLRALLQPLAADAMALYPVSPRVNSVGADDADLLTPVHVLVDPNR